jgi:fatty acid desaturase
LSLSLSLSLLLLLLLLLLLQFEFLAQQIALSYAMFLYCVEHTYEGVYRVPKAEYNRTAAGLLGSSVLSIPWWWRWAAAGVEYHHFHHLNARLPCYRMRVSLALPCVCLIVILAVPYWQSLPNRQTGVQVC